MDRDHKVPKGYEKKFASFIGLCSEAKTKGVEAVVIAYPKELGDTYEEVMESLSRLAKAGLYLTIASPGSSNSDQSEETGSD